MTLARIIPVRLWTRPCRGCDDSSTHTDHLTLFGRLALGLGLPRAGRPS